MRCFVEKNKIYQKKLQRSFFSTNDENVRIRENDRKINFTLTFGWIQCLSIIHRKDLRRYPKAQTKQNFILYFLYL